MPIPASPTNASRRAWGEIQTEEYSVGVSTRLSRHRHQASALLAASLVAFSFSTLVRANVGGEFSQTSKANSTHMPALTAISIVASGNEKLELSGRLKQDSTNYADLIDWTIKSADGQSLFVGASQILSLPLKPGTYEVSAQYGNVNFRETIDLPENTSVSVNFDLNAGALRIAPHLTDEGAPPQLSTTLIYTMTGATAGQLVKTSNIPGEVIKLAAGNYRVETRFANGNVEATTHVEVKAGIMRAVDIALHAGVVELPVLSVDANWTLSNSSNEKIGLTPGASEVALKPGAYVAETKLGNRIIAKSFVVQDGVSQRLSLD